MTYWPGTNIRKSTNNAFDWRTKDSEFMKSFHAFLRQSRAGKAGAVKRAEIGVARGEVMYLDIEPTTYQKTITTFSKAKPKSQ